MSDDFLDTPQSLAFEARMDAYYSARNDFFLASGAVFDKLSPNRAARRQQRAIERRLDREFDKVFYATPLPL